MKTKYFIGGMLAVFILALGISFKADAPSGKIKVTASFYPLYFFASEIAGDRADVANITPAGAEPHDYEPTAQDMVRIENSDLIVVNGGHFEAWAENLQQNINSERGLIVTAGEGLTTKNDPHVWLSPVLAGKMADKIAGALKEADPANAEYYESNAMALKTKLSELDGEYSEGLKSCVQNSIITSHAAFGYMAAAYHLNQVSINGLSPESEPTPRQLIDIAKFAKDNGVKYIFFESLVSPKLSQTIAAEIGAETLVLNPLEGLSKAELAQGKNYLTEMRQNLSNLQKALQCKK